MRPRSWIAALALTPLLGLAACGFGTSESATGSSGVAAPTSLTPVAVVTQATRDATAVGSANFAVTISFNGESPNGGSSGEITGAGAYDVARQAADVTLTLPRSVMSQLGPAGALISGPVRVVATDGVAYVSVPGLSGSRWVKLDPSQPPLSDAIAGLRERAGQAGPPPALGSLDPTTLMNGLSEAIGDAEMVGTESVRGIETTHYRGTVDLAAITAAVVAAGGDAASVPDLSGVTDPAYDIWIDGSNRVVRLSVRAQGTQGTASLTIEQWAFGEPVDVAVPEPGQVVDLADVLPTLDGLDGLDGLTGTGGFVV